MMPVLICAHRGASGQAPENTLAEALVLVGSDFPLNLELKGGPNDLGLAEDLAACLACGVTVATTIVTSFTRELIDHLKSRLPDQTTGLIIGRQGLYPQDLASTHEVLSVPHSQLDEAFMAQATAAGKRVHAWTIDRREEVLRVTKLGVEVVITNHPARVASWLA